MRLPEAPAPLENTPTEVECMTILYSDADIVAAFDAHPLRSKFPKFAGYQITKSADYYGKGYQDVEHRKPSIRKAKELLGWEPKIKLSEGLPKTIEYFRNLLASKPAR